MSPSELTRRVTPAGTGAAALSEAEHKRQELEATVSRFLEEHEIFVCPATLLPPFELGIRYPSTCADHRPTTPGVHTNGCRLPTNWRPTAGRYTPPGEAGIELADYTEWMLCCSAISLTGLPCASVPAGFTASGLPIGVQLVGRMGDEARLLAAAALLEEALGVWRTVPMEPRDKLKEAGEPDSSSGRATYWGGPRTDKEAAAHLKVPLRALGF